MISNEALAYNDAAITESDSKRNIARRINAEQSETEKIIDALVKNEVAVIKNEGSTTISFHEIRQKHGLNANATKRLAQKLQKHDNIAVKKTGRLPMVLTFVSKEEKERMGRQALAYKSLNIDSPYLQEALQGDTANKLSSIYAVLDALLYMKADQGWIRLSSVFLASYAGEDLSITRNVLKELQQKHLLITSRIKDFTPPYEYEEDDEAEKKLIWSIAHLALTKDDYDKYLKEIEERKEIVLRNVRASMDNAPISNYEVLDLLLTKRLEDKVVSSKDSTDRKGLLPLREGAIGVTPKLATIKSVKDAGVRGQENTQNEKLNKLTGIQEKPLANSSNGAIMSDIGQISYTAPENEPQNIKDILETFSATTDTGTVELIQYMQDAFSSQYEIIARKKNEELKNLLFQYGMTVEKKEQNLKDTIKALQKECEDLRKKLKVETNFNEKYKKHIQTEVGIMTGNLLRQFETALSLPKSQRLDKEYCDGLRGDLISYLGSASQKIIMFKDEKVPSEIK